MFDEKSIRLPTFFWKEKHDNSGQKNSYFVISRKMSERIYFEKTSKIEASCEEGVMSKVEKAPVAAFPGQTLFADRTKKRKENL